MNTKMTMLAATLVVAMFLAGGQRALAESRVILTRAPNGGIQPQARMDREGTLHLIYFKGKAGAGDLYYVRRPAGQKEFSPPLRVNSLPGSAIAVGTIRGGQLTLGRNGRVFVVWNGSSKARPRGPANESPLLFTRLNDTGTAFEPQRNLMHKTVALDGGATVAADRAGNVYVAWHALEEQGPKDETHRRVWLTRSEDNGKTWSEEMAVSPASTGACGCCGMRGFVDRHGTVYLMYRSARQLVHRDMYLLVSSDHGQSFECRRLQPWQTNGCPMSSEALAEGSHAVYAAWETNGQVYDAAITKNARGGGTANKPDAAPGDSRARKHPALAVNRQGERLFVWTEGTGWQKGGDLAWQLYDAFGRATHEQGRVGGGIPVWGLATAVARPDGGFEIVY